MVSVRLPKHVAITNHRLGFLHFSIVTILLVGLLYLNFWAGTQYAKSIPIMASLQIHWDEEATVQGMENFLLGDTSWQQRCAGFRAKSSPEQERWGYMWDTRKVCTSLCTLDDLLTFSTWTGPEDSVPTCWSEFNAFGVSKNHTALQFTGSPSQRSLHLITAKNDWIVNHQNRTRTQAIELAPHGKAALVAFRYAYTLQERIPWFLLGGQTRPGEYMRGGNTNAKTVILDAKGLPLDEPIPPGAPIQFTVDEVMSWAGGGPVSQDDLITGAEIDIKAHCLGSDLDVNQWLSDNMQRERGEQSRLGTYAFGASLKSPVCFLRFKIVSNTYKVSVAYGTSTNTGTKLLDGAGAAVEVMSETTGFFFTAETGAGTILVYDFHTIVINVTSMLVMLALPKRLTTFIAVRLLGPISQMYRRIVYEPYDIEVQAAGAGTVIATNTDVFNRHKGLDRDGHEVVDLTTMQSLLRRAMHARGDVLDKKEIASLTHFLYSGIRRLEASDHDRGILGSLCEGILDIAAVGSRRDADDKSPQADGITLDQWSQARLELEKITFGALVRLFDKDRPRNCLERFFTPPGIRHALVQAMDPDSRRELQRQSPGAVVQRGVDWVGKRLSGSPSRASESGVGPVLTTGTSTDEINKLSSLDASHEICRPDLGPGRAAGESAPPLFDDLRRELARFSQRLLEAEKRVLQEPRSPPKAADMGADFSMPSHSILVDANGNMPSHSTLVDMVIRPGRWGETEEPVRGESSCQQLDRRLADMEASLQALQARCDEGPPLEPTRSVRRRLDDMEASLQALQAKCDAGPPVSATPASSARGRRAEPRPLNINDAWAKAVLESFGEDAAAPA